MLKRREQKSMRPECRKQCYRSKEQALGAAAFRMGPDAPNAPWQLHTYECHWCHAWHLTRQRPRRELKGDRSP
jgi:hypothetical protein